MAGIILTKPVEDYLDSIVYPTVKGDLDYQNKFDAAFAELVASFDIDFNAANADDVLQGKINSWVNNR